MNNKTARRLMKIFSALSFILCALFLVYTYKKGIYSSENNLKSFVEGWGVIGVIAFITVQIVQVVFPIIPGGISCLAGVVLFGPWWGFWYNYIGICMGSVIAFLVSRYYGTSIIEFLFGSKKLVKYHQWTSENSRFTKFFAVAIFLPIAPDDFLCYLAGTTKMSLKTFIIIIILGKPTAIAIYSLMLEKIFNWIF